MKVQHVWSVLCKESIINQDDNTISLIHAIETVRVSVERSQKSDQFSIPLQYEIVSLWQKTEAGASTSSKIKYVLCDGGGDELLTNEQTMKMTQKIRRFRSRMKIAGLPITDSGSYKFQVSIKEDGEKKFRKVAEIPLEVKVESSE